MTLQLLTQIAQIVSPVIAAVAAVFAARSSGASSRASAIARDSQVLALEARARELRPALTVSLLGSVDNKQRRYGVEIINEDEINEARDVTVEVSFAGRRPQLPDGTSEEDAEAAYRPRSLRPPLSVLNPGRRLSLTANFSDRAQGDQEVEEEHFSYRAPAYRIRVEYGDEQGIARWKTVLPVFEIAERVGTQIVYDYQPAQQTTSVRVRRQTSADGKVVGAWKVLRGRARATDD